jgi:hypothetical protein
MGLLNWITGGFNADDEHCGDIVRQYLIDHNVTPELWTAAKGRSGERIYAGQGTSNNCQVGFFVKLDEADMKPTGVVIHVKHGLPTHVHNWRRLWKPFERNWSFYEFILHQITGDYEELDNKGKQLSNRETINMAMEVSNYAISVMLRNGFSEDDVIEKREVLLRCAGTAIIIAQAKNMEANCKDVPQELCDVSTKAVDKWLDYQLANKNFANTAEQMIENIRSNHGDDCANEVNKYAFEVHSASHDKYKDDYERHFADTLAAIKECADFLDGYTEAKKIAS